MTAKEFDRRWLIRTSLGGAAAAGIAWSGVSAAGSAYAEVGREDPPLPPVPGMSGDRTANELWYRLDEATLYHRAQETTDALIAIMKYLGTGGEFKIVTVWRNILTSGDYPRDFISYVTPIRPQLQVLSRVQAEVFDRFYRLRSPGLVSAFADFGQGVLFDPRHGNAHIMNGHPPEGYHVWHVYMRAMTLLRIDPLRWRHMTTLNGFAWALQSMAKPDERAVNPPLPRDVVRATARAWLPRTPRRLDHAFTSFPYPAGID